MGGFAIKSTEPRPDLQVVTCHVNVWALQSLNWNPVFFYDIGLELTGLIETQETVLRIYLPFESEREEDLKHVFSDKETAGLVFGEPVDVMNDDRLIFKKRPELTLLSVKNMMAKVPTESRPTQSVIDVTLKAAFKPASRYYVRMRFVAKSLRALWQIKRSLFMTNGATIDLRFLDMRDWFKTEDHHPQSNLLDIQRLQVFVIAPAVFQLRAANPALKYMRTLEPHSWTHYLGRTPSTNKNSKFLIYYWDSQPKRTPGEDVTAARDNDITTLKPMRLFLDVSRDFGYLLPWNLVRIGAIIFALMIVPYGSVRDGIVYGVGHAWAFLVAAILAIGIPTAIAKASASAMKVPKVAIGLRKLYRKLEDSRFRDTH